jgi:uncharacterized protein YcgI (DUF1989 family)
MNELLRETIPAGGRFSTRLETGDRLRIVDLEGQQAVDFLAYAASLPADRYNAANTMKLNGSIYLGKGAKLYSDRAEVLLTIVEDTVGRHDTIGAAAAPSTTMRAMASRTHRAATRISSRSSRAGRCRPPTSPPTSISS